MRVLIAEDDATSRSLLSRILTQWGYEVIATSDGAAAWRELQKEDAPRLAILDWEMPEINGVELCRLVQNLNTTNPPYLILLTAREGKQDIVTGLDAGANDYLGKPFDKNELHARLGVGRRFAELNVKLLEAQQALEGLARTDQLTGSMNRRAILERLDQEIARAQREKTMLGIGMIDIDHFKKVNDEYGHAAGDRVIRTLALRSTRAMRPYDGFGRLGGEEFLVVVPTAGFSDVSVVLERVRRSVEESAVDVEGHSISVTVSIGGTMGGGQSAHELIKAADEALYQAKTQGRNRVVMSPMPPGSDEGDAQRNS
ncbi:MAG: GGDEF domain-containing response regulator [Thermoleophilia bacterium]